MRTERGDFEWRSNKWLQWYRDALIEENEHKGPICDRLIVALGRHSGFRKSVRADCPYCETRRRRLRDLRNEMTDNQSMIMDISEILALRGADLWREDRERNL